MPTSSHRRAALLVGVATLVLIPSSARPAAFAIFEQGARSMGFAGAYTAQGADPSAIFFNAAGIAFLKGNHLAVGAAGIAPHGDFTGANPFPGTTVTEKGDVGLIVPPAFDFTHQFSENLVAGIGLHVPFGLKTAWQNPDTFSGRFISKQAELKGYSINPTVAYKLADRLAIGAGLDYRLSTVELQRNIAVPANPFTLQIKDVAAADLKSNTNTGVGFNIGILARPSDALSIGASYRHKVTIDYDGDATFNRISTGNAQLDALAGRLLPAGATPIKTSITFPAIASGGVAYAWSDWTIEGDFDWYQWSTFSSLPLTFTERPDLSGVIPENYKDTWQFRVGLERHINDRWAVRGGYFFDQSPAPDITVGPLLPDADRNGAALGGTWTSGRLAVDVAYWHLFFKDRSTNGVNRDHYDGTYNSSADLFSVSIRYGF
jgi:long-chain fatty acid transport protein